MSSETMADKDTEAGNEAQGQPLAGSADEPGPVPCRWTHLLMEVDSMQALTAPIRTSGRIMFTCLAVSEHYVAVGCNVGTIYIFNRLSLKYLLMWPESKESGSISHMAFGPDENVLGYSTSQGFVVIIELNLDRRGKADRLRSTIHHKGSTITSLAWNSDGSQLFAGDDMGKVSVSNIPTQMPKDLLRLSSEVIMRLEVPVVQIDAFQNKLVISTTKKTYMGCTVKQQFSQVGQKPRDGQFGCCFYPVSGMQTPVVYSARPGSRLWEVDYDGNVVSTHQFKNSLDMPPLPILRAVEGDKSYTGVLEGSPGPQSLALSRLLLCGEFLVSCCNQRIYVFDPAQVSVVLWTDKVQEVICMQCYGHNLYLLHDHNRVQRLSLLSIPRAVAKLYHLQRYNLAAQLCLTFRASILQPSARKHVSIISLVELASRLESKPKLAILVSFLALQIQALNAEEPADSSSFKELESGMFLRRKRTLSSDSAASDDTPQHELLERLGLVEFEPEAHTPSTNLSGKSDVKGKISDLAVRLKGKLSADSSLEHWNATLAGYVMTYHKYHEKSWDIHPAEGTQEPEEAFDWTPACDTQGKCSAVDLEGSGTLLTRSAISSKETDSLGIPTEPCAVALETCSSHDDGSALGRNIKPLTANVSDFHGERETTDSDIGKEDGRPNQRTDTEGTVLVEETSLPLMTEAVMACQQNPGSSSRQVPNPPDKAQSKVLAAHNEISTECTSADFGLPSPYQGQPHSAQETEDEIGRVGKPSPGDSCYESDFTQAAQDLEDNLRQPSGAQLDSDPTRSCSGLRRVNSVDSILSSEQDSEGMSSRRGSFTSISLSSNELVFGPPTLDPEPVYKETLGVVRGKGKKKKPQIVNLEPDSAKQQTSANRNRKFRKPKTGGTGNKRSPLILGSPVTLSSPQSSSRAPSPVTHRSMSSSAPLHESPVVVTASQVPAPGNQISDWPASWPGALGEGYSLRPGLVGMKASLSSKAKSLVQTLKNQSDRLQPKRELPEPLDVATSPTQHVATGTDNAIQEDDAGETCRRVAQSPRPAPVVSLDDLDCATRHAKEKLSVPKTLFNPESLRDVLQEWVVHLNQALLMLHQSQLPDGSTPAIVTAADNAPSSPLDHDLERLRVTFQHLEDPFRTPEELHSAVTELATLCFELEIHGNITKFVCTGQGVGQSFKVSSSHENGHAAFSGFVGTFKNVDDTDSDKCVEQSPSAQPAHGSVSDFHALGMQDPIQQDVNMAHFLYSHFHCMSPERIYSAIHQRAAPSYQQWLALVQCLATEGSNKGDSPESVQDLGRNRCFALAYLNSLYTTSPATAVEQCAQWMSILHPLDVVYMCQTAKHDSYKAHISTYVQKYLALQQATKSRDTAWHVLLQKREVVWCVLESLLAESPSEAVLCCHCGYPRPGAHKTKWRHHELLQEFLKHVGSVPGCITFEEMLLQLMNAGYWQGCLQLCHQISAPQKDYVGWVIQLADASLLSQSLPWGYWPTTVEKWQEVLRLRAQQDGAPLGHRMDVAKLSVSCLNCGVNLAAAHCLEWRGGTSSVAASSSDTDDDLLPPDALTCKEASDCSLTLKWEELARLLVRGMGTTQGLTLLKELNLPSGTLSPRFYRSCVMSHFIDKQHRVLVHNLVSQVDTFLWSNHQTVLPAQLVQVVEAEKALATGKDAEISKATLKQASNTEVKRHMEETVCHWGLYTQFRDCQVCGVPLQLQTQIESSMVLIFQCGHGYHKNCLDDGAAPTVCLVCACR